MTKYARVRDGHLIDVYDVPRDFPDLATLNRCLPVGDFISVPDDIENGAKIDSDGTYANPPIPPPIGPNTSNNPYFGKQKLTGAGFVGLCIGVLGVTAANRITKDDAFSSIKLWVTTADVVVDPDDKAGQFLALAGLPGADGYLTTALAADGQPLMTRAQRDSIMEAWS